MTVAVAMTLGAGTVDLGAAPGPAGGWGGRALRDAFHYVDVTGGGGQFDYHDNVPQAAAVDAAALIGSLDPDRSHLRARDSGEQPPRIVGDDDPALKDAEALFMDSAWYREPADNGASLSVQRARLAYMFYRDVNVLRQPVVAMGGAVVPQPCGLTVDLGFRLGMERASSPMPAWSACRTTVLADGSRVQTTSAAFGAGTETVAIRIFGSGNVVSVIGWDYPEPGGPDPATPVAPESVVTPSPWSADRFRAALSDPAIAPVFDPRPAPNADGRLLMPADLGPDWNFDQTEGQVTTGEFVMDNGCPRTAASSASRPAAARTTSAGWPTAPRSAASRASTACRRAPARRPCATPGPPARAAAMSPPEPRTPGTS
ncbi:hypothetical protein ACFQ9X_52930 [Catenulispora yoronensis]